MRSDNNAIVIAAKVGSPSDLYIAGQQPVTPSRFTAARGRTQGAATRATTGDDARVRWARPRTLVTRERRVESRGVFLGACA